MLIIFFKNFLYIIILLILGAYLTYIERRVIAFVQLRKGPNVAGIYGLLQPIADTIKLIAKEFIIPKKANKTLFILAPIITFVLSLAIWPVIPLDYNLVYADINVGILYIMAIFSLSTYGTILAGWSSRSRYAFLASIRAVTQLISYEIIFGLIIVLVILLSESLRLIDIVEAQKYRPLWLNILLIPIKVIFFITILIKTNRCPFDISEAESELVSGYSVEYSSMGFGLLYLGEYINIISANSINILLFWGGYLLPFNIKCLSFLPGYIWFSLKTSISIFLFILIRATFPRYRYDQLLNLCWKILLPFTFFWLIFISIVLFCTKSIKYILL